MNINYRKATKNDFDALYELAILFTEFNATSSGNRERFFWHGWEEDFKKEIQISLEDSNSTYFVAESSELGLFGYILSRNCPECGHYLLEELFVKPEARSNNVGSTLLAMAVTEGKKLEQDIRIEIFSWNEHAKNFYLKHGFKLDALVLEYSK